MAGWLRPGRLRAGAELPHPLAHWCRCGFGSNCRYNHPEPCGAGAEEPQGGSCASNHKDQQQLQQGRPGSVAEEGACLSQPVCGSPPVLWCPYPPTNPAYRQYREQQLAANGSPTTRDASGAVEQAEGGSKRKADTEPELPASSGCGVGGTEGVSCKRHHASLAGEAAAAAEHALGPGAPAGQAAAGASDVAAAAQAAESGQLQPQPQEASSSPAAEDAGTDLEAELNALLAECLSKSSKPQMAQGEAALWEGIQSLALRFACLSSLACSGSD